MHNIGENLTDEEVQLNIKCRILDRDNCLSVQNEDKTKIRHRDRWFSFEGCHEITTRESPRCFHQQVDEMIQEADVDGDGRISFDGKSHQQEGYCLKNARSPTSSELWPRFSWPVTKFHQKDFYGLKIFLVKFCDGWVTPSPWLSWANSTKSDHIHTYTREVHELAVSVQYFRSFRPSRKDRYFVDRNRQFVDLPRIHTQTLCHYNKKSRTASLKTQSFFTQIGQEGTEQLDAHHNLARRARCFCVERCSVLVFVFRTLCWR